MGFFEQWGLLIFGLILLVFSGDFLVRGSVSIAKRFNISSMVVGMTIVAFGTSAPELLVSVNAAISGHPEIALGNVIGSNIANIALVLGLTATIIVLPVRSRHLTRDWAIMISVSLLFVLLLATNDKIGRPEGIILVILLVVFIIFSIKNGDAAPEVHGTEKPDKLWVALLLIALSSAGLAYGADFLVKGASNIALGWGVSERVISITIVAFGTSVPELTASVISALRKQTDISIGNIIGSNLFNILAVIGITSTIKPIEASFNMFKIDFIWMILISTLLIFLVSPMRIGKLKKDAVLTKWGGVFLVSIYITYVYLLF